MGTVTHPVLNERVILTLRGGEASTEQVSATVEDLPADGRIGLHVSDTFAGFGPPIRPGSFVSMDCRRADGLWRMTSLVESVQPGVGHVSGPDLLVSPPNEARLVDRRRFLRVHANLTMRLAAVDLPEKWDPADAKAVRLRAEWQDVVDADGMAATVFSLGAGGVAASVEEALPTGTGIFVVVDDARLSFSTPARVVWHEAAAPGGRDRIGCEFLRFPPVDEDRVLRYVVQTRHRRVRLRPGP